MIFHQGRKFVLKHMGNEILCGHMSYSGFQTIQYPNSFTCVAKIYTDKIQLLVSDKEIKSIIKNIFNMKNDKVSDSVLRHK